MGDTPVEKLERGGRRFVRWALAFEAALLGLAWLLAKATGRPLVWHTGSPWTEVGLGVMASIPPLLFLIWSVESRFTYTAPIQEVLEQRLLPWLAQVPVWQLAVLSLFAGLGEEALFRGWVQSWLEVGLGSGPGLALTALAFGALHAVNRPYFVVASCIGLFLGLQYAVRDSLLAPMACHALYDFVALVYLTRRQQRESTG